jgi:hypothetical protein
VESCCECGNEPSGSIKDEKLSSGFTTGGLSSSAQLHIASYVAVSGRSGATELKPRKNLSEDSLYPGQDAKG